MVSIDPIFQQTQADPIKSIGRPDTIGFSPIDSMNPSRQTPFSAQQDRIEILPPKEYRPKQRSLAATLVNMVELLHRVRENSLEEKQGYFESKACELERENSELAKLQMEKMDDQKVETFWDYFGKVSMVVLSSVSILIGSTLIASGAGVLPGAALIGSGALGISSIILKEMQADPALVATLAITGAILGVSGSIVNFSALSNDLPHLISIIASSLVNATYGVTEIGTGIHQRNMLVKEGEKQLLDERRSIKRSDLDMGGASLQSAVKSFQQTEQTAARIAQQQSDLNQYVMQSFSNAGIAG